MKFREMFDLLRAERPRVLGYVSGVFDVFHEGHQRYIDKCKERCEILVIGVDSNARVASTKGPSRPFDDQFARVKNVGLVNKYVFIKVLRSHNYINILRPEILFYPSDRLEKGEILSKIYNDCNVVMIEITPLISSTKIIQSMQSEGFHSEIYNNS